MLFNENLVQLDPMSWVQLQFQKFNVLYSSLISSPVFKAHFIHSHPSIVQSSVQVPLNVLYIRRILFFQEKLFSTQ